MKNDKFAKWMQQLSAIHKNFPFGPIRRLENEVGALHHDIEPAYVSPTRCTWYQNGRRHGIDVDIFGSIFYYYEGIQIPKSFYEERELLTLEQVFQHPNTEVRYVGIKMVGFERVMEKARIIHTSEKGGGMILFGLSNIVPETELIVLKVINSTPEADGTSKNYFLMVPPEMKTCEEAVAWTFSKSPEDYHPSQET